MTIYRVTWTDNGEKITEDYSTLELAEQAKRVLARVQILAGISQEKQETVRQ